MKALPGDAAFARLASQYVLLQVDTKNGRAEHCTRLGLNRNRAYFLVLDAKGNEIDRMFAPGPRAQNSPVLLWIMESALAAGKGKPLQERLIHLLGDPHHSYRADAVAALGRLGPKAAGAVPALLPMLRDRSGTPSVSWRTTIALKEIGPAAKAAIPHLQKLIWDKTRPDSERQMALAALGRLDPKGETVLPPLRLALKGKGVLVIGAALAARDLGKVGASLIPELEAAAKRYPRGAGYIRQTLEAIRAKR